jgi:hypothetical protein
LQYDPYVLPYSKVTLTTQVSGQINLGSSLVAYSKLDGNTNDESVLGINGTATGTTLTTGKTGVTNTAYSFNGTNSGIECGTGNRGVVDTITISAWVKTTSLSLGFIVGKYDWVANKGYHLFITNGNIALAGRNNGSTYINTRIGSVGNFVAYGNWHFVVGEIAGNRWTAWVDCIQVNQVFSTASSPNLAYSESLTIGYYDEVNNSPSLFYDGDIDESL